MVFAHITALAAVAVCLAACEPNGQQVVSEPRGSAPSAPAETTDPLAATGTAGESAAPTATAEATASAAPTAAPSAAPVSTAKTGPAAPPEPIKCGSRFPPCPGGMTCSDGRAGVCR